MAKYDQGGGCACGVNKECNCSNGNVVAVSNDYWKFAPEQPSENIPYKFEEGQIIADFKAYIDKTYGQHYKSNKEDVTSIECFDAWIALGDSMPTFRNTALKYLWRYGKKNDSNKDDLMKALHYVLMCLYVDHYRPKKGE